MWGQSQGSLSQLEAGVVLARPQLLTHCQCRAHRGQNSRGGIATRAHTHGEEFQQELTLTWRNSQQDPACGCQHSREASLPHPVQHPLLAGAPRAAHHPL